MKGKKEIQKVYIHEFMGLDDAENRRIFDAAVRALENNKGIYQAFLECANEIRRLNFGEVDASISPYEIQLMYSGYLMNNIAKKMMEENISAQ